MTPEDNAIFFCPKSLKELLIFHALGSALEGRQNIFFDF